MEALERKVFLSEVCLQCEFALDYFNELPAPTGTEDKIVGTAHSFLVHTAAVSSLLWPRPIRMRGEAPDHFKRRQEYAEKRGKELRKFLALPDAPSDHVLGNRELRNHLEHFDERLDQFLMDGGPKSFADRIVRKDLVNFDFPLERCLRVFSISDLTFVFLGTPFPLQPLAEALRKLKAAI